MANRVSRHVPMLRPQLQGVERTIETPVSSTEVVYQNCTCMTQGLVPVGAFCKAIHKPITIREIPAINGRRAG
jgi:hypothetical protein